MHNKYCHTFHTRFGWAAIAVREGRVSRFLLPVDDLQGLESQMFAFDLGRLPRSDADESCVASQIQAYFAGESMCFRCEPDYCGRTDFEISVWEAARTIPYGDTVSYMALAGVIGNSKASRAVGQALGRNPIPVIVPCHRILRSDGGLGGFSAGLHWKTRLLDIEKSSN